MTNLEWIRTLSAEELADWVYDEWLHHLQYHWSSSRGGLIIWLKDRKTEPQTMYYPQVDGITPSVIVKDEPQTETKTETQNSNSTFEKRTMRDCYNCKRYETEGECIECHYEPKDEPQTERSSE